MRKVNPESRIVRTAKWVREKSLDLICDAMMIFWRDDIEFIAAFVKDSLEQGTRRQTQKPLDFSPKGRRPLQPTDPTVSAALDEIEKALGKDAVLRAQDAAPYGENCTGIARSVPAAVYPKSSEEVQAVVRIVAQAGVPLYPVSTGRNWGYGSATPMTDGCIVVDLSRMDRVLAFDAELGVVTVEPGVTQAKLRAFLDRNGLEYMVPTTGAGPHCSIMGNALERGFGLTPHCDHFGAVMSLEAILPNGDVYRSPLAEAGAHRVGRLFKWGVGPYLDGLFSQGNLGVVTQVSIALAPKSERFMAFFFRLDNECDLERIIPRIREIVRKFGGNLGGINLMNSLRVMALSQRCPEDYARAGVSIPKNEVEDLAAAQRVGAWTAVGTLYGTKEVVNAIRKAIRRSLDGEVKRLLFVEPESLNRLSRILSRVPLVRDLATVRQLSQIRASLSLLGGSPSEVALPIIYWRAHSSRSAMPGKSMIDPDVGNQGLLWYAPLIPLDSKSARDLNDMVTRICHKHGFDPLLTYTTISDRCSECTIPILFDRSREEEAERARRCYEELFKEGQYRGFVPYRTGIQGTALLVQPDSTFWKLQKLIKEAIDPNKIIAPGRYEVVASAPNDSSSLNQDQKPAESPELPSTTI